MEAAMTTLTPDMTFTEAWPVWFRAKRLTLSKSSQRCYGEYLRHLGPFFGALHLSDIKLEHFHEYQETRGAKVCAGTVNHELDAVAQILEKLELWQPIKKHFKRLKVPKGSNVGLRLTDEELAHLAEVAARKPQWRVAYLCMMIQTQTAAGPAETLSIRLRDIDWDANLLHIPGTKTDSRPREIPMTEDCVQALKQAELLAREKGAYRPEHYLFPHQRGPEEHALHYHGAWYSLCREAAKKFPRLAKVRRYDIRHSAISRMCENPNIDEATLKKVVGHGPGSKLMFEVYFHSRNKRKAEAVSVLSGITRPKHQALFEPTKRPPRSLPLRTEETDPLEVLMQRWMRRPVDFPCPVLEFQVNGTTKKCQGRGLPDPPDFSALNRMSR
jgi:integrase